jgi:hypothetical protein
MPAGEIYTKLSEFVGLALCCGEMRIDVHQHIWTAPLIEAETPARRTRLVAADGLDRALVALSSPIGIEALERDDAVTLIDAHLKGVEALGEPFGRWGPVALDRLDPDDVDRLLASGCVGISVPAGALAGHDALAVIRPLLLRVAERHVPLFVHPGYGPRQRPAEVSLTDPLWWQPLTTYVAQMQAAWLAFATEGRREHPRLVVVFAMLAGCAPLLRERLVMRGGPAGADRDTLTFYETSSFGPVAIAAMARLVGESQLVYGSDRPVVEPVTSALDPVLRANSAKLFSKFRSDTGDAAAMTMVAGSAAA